MSFGSGLSCRVDLQNDRICQNKNPKLFHSDQDFSKFWANLEIGNLENISRSWGISSFNMEVAMKKKSTPQQIYFLTKKTTTTTFA